MGQWPLDYFSPRNPEWRLTRKHAGSESSGPGLAWDPTLGLSGPKSSWPQFPAPGHDVRLSKQLAEGLRDGDALAQQRRSPPPPPFPPRGQSLLPPAPLPAHQPRKTAHRLALLLPASQNKVLPKGLRSHAELFSFTFASVSNSLTSLNSETAGGGLRPQGEVAGREELNPWTPTVRILSLSGEELTSCQFLW